jgi:uncharacterized protein YjiS (DUF1127 family)
MTSRIAPRAKIRTERWAPIGSAVAALTRGAWQFVVAVKHRRELRGLNDLDDHLLADIAIRTPLIPHRRGGTRPGALQECDERVTRLAITCRATFAI